MRQCLAEDKTCAFWPNRPWTTKRVIQASNEDWLKIYSIWKINGTVPTYWFIRTLYSSTFWYRQAIYFAPFQVSFLRPTKPKKRSQLLNKKNHAQSSTCRPLLLPRPWSTHGTAIIPVFMSPPGTEIKKSTSKCWMKKHHIGFLLFKVNGHPIKHSQKGSRKSHLQFKLRRSWVKLKPLRHFAKSDCNQNTTHDSLLF